MLLTSDKESFLLPDAKGAKAESIFDSRELKTFWSCSFELPSNVCTIARASSCERGNNTDLKVNSSTS